MPQQQSKGLMPEEFDFHPSMGDNQICWEGTTSNLRLKKRKIIFKTQNGMEAGTNQIVCFTLLAYTFLRPKNSEIR